MSMTDMARMFAANEKRRREDDDVATELITRGEKFQVARSEFSLRARVFAFNIRNNRIVYTSEFPFDITQSPVVRKNET